MEYSNIKVARENSIATIRLNRPDAMNALSSELLREFSDAVAGVGQDQSIKALVVRGEDVGARRREVVVSADG